MNSTKPQDLKYYKGPFVDHKLSTAKNSTFAIQSDIIFERQGHFIDNYQIEGDQESKTRGFALSFTTNFMHSERYTDDMKQWEHTLLPLGHGVYCPFTLRAFYGVTG